MKQNEDVFLLIKSLSKGEKKFFKLFSSDSKAEKNYLRLFVTLEKQKRYNEKKLKQKFSAFAFDKIYLQKQILKALRVYHAESTPELQLRSMNIETEILTNKWQRTLAEKSARKTLALAEQNGRLFQMSVALNHLDWLFTDKEVSDTMYDEWKGFLEKNKSVQQSLLNITEMRLMNNELTYFSKRFGNAVSANEKKQIKKMLSHVLLSKKTKLNSLHENIERIYLKARIYYRLGLLKQEAEMYLEAISYYEKVNAEGRYFYLKNFISAISDYINCRIELKQFKGLETFFEKYNSLKKQTPEDTTQWLAGISLRDKLKFYCATQNTQQGLKVAESIKLAPLHAEHQLQIKYYSALLMFQQQLFKSSSKMLEHILNSEKEFSLDYFFTASRVLLLMNYYELKDFDLLHHRAISAKRALESKKQLFALEKELLNFFIKAEVDTRKAGFSKLHTSLTKILKDKKEKSAIQELDVMGWVESKITTK